MSCTYKNDRAERSFKVLATALRDSITAESIMGRNNGYSLEDTWQGNPSKLYQDILDIVEDEGMAHSLKATIYRDTFSIEPTMNEFSQMTEEQRKVKAKTYTRDSMREAVYKDALWIARRNTPKERKVRGIKGIPSQIFSLHAAQTAAIINKEYKQKIAYYEGNVVRIFLTNEILDNFLTDQVQKEHAQIVSDLVHNVKNKKKVTGTQLVIDFEQQNDYSDYDLIDSVMDSGSDENFINYVAYLSHDKKKLEDRLYALRQKKKVWLHGGRKQRQAIINKIVRIKQQLKKIEKNIDKLQTPGLEGTAFVKRIQKMATEDMNRVRALIDPPLDKKTRKQEINSEDLFEAKDILDWYQTLGNFEKDSPHPFFANNTTYDNEEIKSILRKIANDAASLEDLLNSKIKEKTYQRLVNHKNYDKLELDISMEDLFDAEVPDIDIFSAYGLNPNFTFNFKKNVGDNLIAQLMSEYYTEILSEKDGYVRNKISEIDTYASRVKEKLGGNFDLFYQKDEDGNLLPFLIDLFSDNWYGFLTSVGKIEGDSIADRNRKRYNYIKKNADIIDVALLPEVQQQYGSSFNKYGVEMPSAQESEQYKRDLIARLGKSGYDKLVERQLLQIDEFFLTKNAEIKERMKKNEELSMEDREFIIKFDMENNPFKLKNADRNGNLTAKFGHSSFVVAVSTRFNQYIPKANDTNGYINEDFKTINEDPLYSKFWELLSESLMYINSIYAATGENVTFNSLFDMEMSIWKMIRTQKKNTKFFRKLFTKIIDRLKNKMTVNDGQFVQKDESETTVDTSKLKSLRTKISRQVNSDMKHARRLLKMKIADDTKSVHLDGKLKTFLADILTSEQYKKLENKGTKLTYGDVKEAVRKDTTKRIMDEQNLDMPKMIKINLAHAARIDASQEAIPVLRIMKSFYTSLKSGKGKDEVRENANKRINHWYDRVVRGYFGSKGFPAPGRKILTSDEKQKVKRLRELLLITQQEAPILARKREKPLVSEQQILDEIAQLGKPFNYAFILSTVQSWMITWAMSYNIKSGAFNLFYGYYQNKYFDNLGTYWTPGNAEPAFHFVLGKGRKNLYKAGTAVGAGQVFNWKRHAQQITIAELLMNKMSIIQDMRNEQQKASERLGKSDFSKKLNPYYMSITAVEWRNQSTTILATLMDAMVENPNTHEMVQVFDGKQFNIYDNVDGILRLKDEFRYTTDADGKIIEHEANIDNWEKMIGSDFASVKINAMNAVVAVHGDYSNTGGMLIKDNPLGKIGMTFLTFLPMLLHGRWGAGINLAAGTKREKAVYKSAPASVTGLGVGILIGSIFGPVAGIGLGVAAGIAKGRFSNVKPKQSDRTLKNIAKRQEKTHPGFDDGSRGRDLAIDYAVELLQTLKLYSASALNIPLTLLVGKEIITIDPSKTHKASPEDARAIKAIIYELGFITNFLLMKALAKMAFYCEEDTEFCKKKTHMKNFLANNLNRALSDMTIAANPFESWNVLATQGAFLRTVTNLGDWLYKLEIFMTDRTSDIITSGEFVGQSKYIRATDKLLLPSILKSTGLASFRNTDIKNGDINPFMTNKSEWTLPNEFRKDYEFNGSFIEENFLKSDLVKAEEIIASKRAKYGVELKEENENRKSKWSDYDITKKKNAKYPTLKQIAAKYKKMYGVNWKSHYNDEISNIVKNN